jgi:hypothetical protein
MAVTPSVENMALDFILLYFGGCVSRKEKEKKGLC